jgi:hypothetical protein
MAINVAYNVEVVGVKGTENIKSEEMWRAYIAKTWETIGPLAVKNIQTEIGNVKWKKANGSFPRAVSWRADKYKMIVFMDPAIAPHAVYQEIGVHEHTMLYLLTATRPIPVPTGESYLTDPKKKYPRTVFRWATQRWMGVPHPYTDQRGVQRMATGWVHPGYEGKRFFRKGIDATLEEATRHLKLLVFKLTENIERTDK